METKESAAVRIEEALEKVKEMIAEQAERTRDDYIDRINIGRKAFLKRLDTKAKGSAGRICKPISRMEIVLKIKEKSNGTES